MCVKFASSITTSDRLSTICRTGRWNAVVFWYELNLTQDITVSTGPANIGSGNMLAAASAVCIHVNVTGNALNLVRHILHGMPAMSSQGLVSLRAL